MGETNQDELRACLTSDYFVFAQGDVSVAISVSDAGYVQELANALAFGTTCTLDSITFRPRDWPVLMRMLWRHDEWDRKSIHKKLKRKGKA